MLARKDGIIKNNIESRNEKQPKFKVQGIYYKPIKS